MILAYALRRVVSCGRLTLIDANGRAHVIEGDEDGPSATIRLHDRALPRKLLTNPLLHVGEGYMDGTLTIEEGTLEDFLEFACRNLTGSEDLPFFSVPAWFGYKLRWLQQYNPVARAQANVAHHYDLSGRLYDLFLDEDRQYSCGYFLRPDETLEEAQENKKRHLGAKLMLEPGMKVLDIGCGWGGLGLYLAREADVSVTGVTLSTEQYHHAKARAREAGLDDRVDFKLLDYREARGTFDRIVSVGMFEHVGASHFREFFAKARDLLTDDGVLLLHSIGRMEPPGNTNAWLRKYIFPGGYTPAMSEVLAAVERERLYVTDIEILRLHYARTLSHWYDRFAANRAEVERLYDERFCRMWEFYLKGCEVAFKYFRQMVFQMQITKRQEAAPLVRDYMVDWERAHGAPQPALSRPDIAA